MRVNFFKSVPSTTVQKMVWIEIKLHWTTFNKSQLYSRHISSCLMSTNTAFRQVALFPSSGRITRNPATSFDTSVGATAPQWATASSFTRFLDHTQRRTTIGRAPLDEWSARRRDLYLTTHNTHNRQTSMPRGGDFVFVIIHNITLSITWDIQWQLHIDHEVWNGFADRYEPG